MVSAAYAAGPPHALGGGGGCAAYAVGLHREFLREEGADLQGFVPDQDHQLLVEVYGDKLH